MPDLLHEVAGDEQHARQQSRREAGGVGAVARAVSHDPVGVSTGARQSQKGALPVFNVKDLQAPLSQLNAHHSARLRVLFRRRLLARSCRAGNRPQRLQQALGVCDANAPHRRWPEIEPGYEHREGDAERKRRGDR